MEQIGRFPSDLLGVMTPIIKNSASNCIARAACIILIAGSTTPQQLWAAHSFSCDAAQEWLGHSWGSLATQGDPASSSTALVLDACAGFGWGILPGREPDEALSIGNYSGGF